MKASHIAVAISVTALFLAGCDAQHAAKPEQPNPTSNVAAALPQWPPKSAIQLDETWRGDFRLSLLAGFKFGSTRRLDANDGPKLLSAASPDPSDPGTASGQIETSVGEHKATATVTKAGFVYSDESAKAPVESGVPIVTEGEMIVPYLFDTSNATDKYVDNSFSAKLIGSKWTIITIDKDKGDKLNLPVVPDKESSPAPRLLGGGITITDSVSVMQPRPATVAHSWNWPGTKVRLDNRVLERRKDGWYEEGKKISP